MTLEKQAGWWKWLVNPKMAILYALLLPLGLNVVGSVFFEISYSIDLLQQDRFVRWSWFLEICMQTTLELLGILLLANMALGKRKQPVPSLLYRSWLWTAAAALCCALGCPGWQADSPVCSKRFSPGSISPLRC